MKSKSFKAVSVLVCLFLILSVFAACSPKNPDNPVSPSNPDRPVLPQTGQLNWPVPVLACSGVLLFAAGWVLNRQGKKEN